MGDPWMIYMHTNGRPMGDPWMTYKRTMNDPL